MRLHIQAKLKSGADIRCGCTYRPNCIQIAVLSYTVHLTETFYLVIADNGINLKHFCSAKSGFKVAFNAIFRI